MHKSSATIGGMSQRRSVGGLVAVAGTLLVGCTGNHDDADTSRVPPDTATSSSNSSSRGEVGASTGTPPRGDADALDECRTRAGQGFPDFATDVSVAAGFSTDAGVLAHWLATKPMSESGWMHDARLEALPADHKFSLCYFDGDIKDRARFGTAPAPTTSDRFVLAVDRSGHAILIGGGTGRSTWPLVRPG